MVTFAAHLEPCLNTIYLDFKGSNPNEYNKGITSPKTVFPPSRTLWTRMLRFFVFRRASLPKQRTAAGRSCCKRACLHGLCVVFSANQPSINIILYCVYSNPNCWLTKHSGQTTLKIQPQISHLLLFPRSSKVSFILLNGISTLYGLFKAAIWLICEYCNHEYIFNGQLYFIKQQFFIGMIWSLCIMTYQP